MPVGKSNCNAEDAGDCCSRIRQNAGDYRTRFQIRVNAASPKRLQDGRPGRPIVADWRGTTDSNEFAATAGITPNLGEPRAVRPGVELRL
ncbi:MAG: hypothetical protein JWN70_7089 [Planctomycetaceae bacterium]|nr:hypothetical protein [Planctomycetaceae bacterium]